ncbi:TetR family transcriptional regulator [Propioniferax innocua]|uniref:TetR family transcriptional regulator n=1 Tax=Propioniferax innocua TaxID=1753 RepID=A0A542ZBB6_9ACTN|nr:TetR family transcriptional regulator [Propioniferax innocua]TQL57606.1 TetR family transcriptional regulator [Propioniferax innocua]
MALDRHEILMAAQGILETYGLADLSMRRIATQLGVQPGALYWHIDNKQGMLAALSDEILRDLPNPTGSPAAIIMTWARAFRAALLAHRDAAELVASVISMRLGEISPITHLTRLLPGPRASLTAAVVTHFVLGHCFDEQGHAQLVELGVTDPDPDFPGDEAFEHGLALLVAGLDRV